MATLSAGMLPKRADAGTIQLRGTLVAASDDKGNMSYFTDPDEDSESVTLQPEAQGFVEQWLKGSVGRHTVITIEATREKQ